jgi:hypothetical protein
VKRTPFFSSMSSILMTTLLLWMTGTGSLRVFAQAFAVGETIEYKVSYLGINLGTVKVVTESQPTLNGQQVVKAKGLIDSNPNIPFASIHAIFETWFDSQGRFSYQFLSTLEQSKDTWQYDKYEFKYDEKKIRLESGVKGVKEKEYELQTARRWHDGLSLFFMARQFLRSGKNASVPTIIEGDTTRTDIYFASLKSENVEIKAANYPVKTMYFKGEAKWRGVYGLTGKFEGWFSDDNAAVPIRAKMNTLVGNVDIELVKWNRTGNWQPPRG